MAEKSHKQRVEQMVFAAHHAYSNSRAKNQIKSAPERAAKGKS